MQLLHPLSTDSACQLLKLEHYKDFVGIKKKSYEFYLYISLSRSVYHFRVLFLQQKYKIYKGRTHPTCISADAQTSKLQLPP